jgi:hypothetical protein
MIYFQCIDGELPPIKKLVKGKPHLERLLARGRSYLKKVNRKAVQAVNLA